LTGPDGHWTGLGVLTPPSPLRLHLNQMTPPGRDNKTIRKLPILIDPAELGGNGRSLLMARSYHRIRASAGGQLLDRHSLSLAQFEVLAVLRFGEGG